MSPASPDVQAYTPRLGAGVALLSLSLLMTEIVLTRIFSVVIWYHFAFLAISVALFGTAAAAIAVHLAQARLSRWPLALPVASALLAVSTVVADVVLIRVVPAWFGHGNPEVHLTARLLAMFLVTAAPFFFAGAALGLALLRGAARVHRLYFWDLVGAGAGCLGVIGLLQWFGGPMALLACAGVGAGAALLFGASVPIRGTGRYVPGVLALLAVLGVAAAHAGTGLLDLHYAKGRDLRAQPPEFARWNSHSLVTVIDEPHFRGWGMSPAHEGPMLPRKSVIIDMNALTVMTRFDGDLARARYLHDDLSGFVYHAKPDPKRVCVLGAGGGRDVLAGLVAGAEHVTGVEINPLIVRDVMGGAYREFTGGLYARDDVSIVLDDGRSYLRATGDRFDVLLVSMVDTSAATAAGAYALTENNLYTVEAFSDFMDRLAPGGMLSVSSVSLPGLAVGARLVSLAAASLRARGIDPTGAVAVVDHAWLGLPGAVMHNVIVKPEGFSTAELARIRSAAARLKFVPSYVPGQAPAEDPARRGLGYILEESDPEALAAWYAALPLDVSPVFDDRPFFFYQDRLRHFLTALMSASAAHPFGNGLVFLAKLLLVSLVMVGLCILVPLGLRRAEGGRPATWELALSACLGLGFMLLEMALVQRLTGFLGNPTHTLAAVLGVLLLAGGTGSRFAARLSLRGAAVPRILLSVAACGGALALAMPGLLHAAQAAPAPVRALVAAALMVPLGLLLGMPLPSLLKHAANADARRLPWLWGVNGATSVLGSVLATFISLHAGITATLLCGTAVYAVAAVVWRVGAGRPVTG